MRGRGQLNIIINDNGWGYGEKRSDDAVEGGVGVRGWGGAVEEQGEGRGGGGGGG